MDQAIEPPPAKDRRTGIRVLVILGHPRKESFCAAIANAYATGASAAGAEVRLLFVADMQFNPNVVTASPRQQPVEPSLASSRWSPALQRRWNWSPGPITSSSCSRPGGAPCLPP
jgi:hypothetical protein